MNVYSFFFSTRAQTQGLSMLGRYPTMELQCLSQLFLKSHIIHGFIKYFEKITNYDLLGISLAH